MNEIQLNHPDLKHLPKVSAFLEVWDDDVKARLERHVIYRFNRMQTSMPQLTARQLISLDNSVFTELRSIIIEIGNSATQVMRTTAGMIRVSFRLYLGGAVICCIENVRPQEIKLVKHHGFRFVSQQALQNATDEFKHNPIEFASWAFGMFGIELKPDWVRTK